MTIYDKNGQPYEADLVDGVAFREIERENAKLREESEAARRALDPEDELSSLSIAEIAALRSIK